MAVYCTPSKSLFMCDLLPIYSCTGAVPGPLKWLQAADSLLVTLAGTVSQPGIAVSAISDAGDVAMEMGASVGGRGG